MKLLRDNGLTIVLLLLSGVTMGGMLVSGWAVYDNDLVEHGRPQINLLTYGVSGHFLSSLFENWESEFLQMSAYVMLTAYLFQRGSAESKDPDERADPDGDPAGRIPADSPWPVRFGGWVRQAYSYSLGAALGMLFVVTFVLHLKYSAEASNVDAITHGQAIITIREHLSSSQFWFESFQNWQSEFLSTAVVVVLSIFLRFKGSPESKRVAAPHHETGG